MKTLPETSGRSQEGHLMKAPGYDRILVPTDFSTPSLYAVKTALDLVKDSKGAITLIHVVDPIPPLALVESGLIAADDLERRVAEAERDLSVLAHDYSNGIQIAFRVGVGSPDAEISKMATLERFDVIALTSHGRSGFPRMLLGSTAEAVLRLAHTPVLVIKPSITRPEQGTASVLQADWRHILVGYDFRDESKAILEMASRIAITTHAKITLIHAILPWQTSLAGRDAFELRDTAMTVAESNWYLKNLRRRHMLSSVACDVVSVIGDPGQVLAEHAREAKCDLIIVGVHEPDWPIELGSGTAEKLVREAPCSVWALR